MFERFFRSQEAMEKLHDGLKFIKDSNEWYSLLDAFNFNAALNTLRNHPDLRAEAKAFKKRDFVNADVSALTREDRAVYLLLIMWLFGLHVTEHDATHKLAGMQSISTSVLRNPFCQGRRKCSGVCQHCFAANLAKCYSDLAKSLWRNTDVLRNYLLTDSDLWKLDLYGRQEKLNRRAVKNGGIPTSQVRFESFGDTSNLLDAENKIRIAKFYDELDFGLWSKNFAVWAEAFDRFGKPENLTFVASSYELNERIELPESIRPYVDHRFTVWTPEEYRRLGLGKTPGACAGIRCVGCGKCYKHGGPFDIDEMLR